ncbi:4463_t:CDS:2 [Acaulospora colombiana]|uniref:4463_t:CDS:1 n=1 Tax=Acaulospora colombiana TaxID=27376 RepID=A0ACA9L7L8_9GLOM|nr:4463_t:CDS:2 [Acaulospora colombiana]
MSDVEQEPPTKSEVSTAREPRVVEKSRKRKHEGNTHSVPVDRPRRTVHPVVLYSQVSEAKSRTRKPVEVVQGEGVPLGQISSIVRAIDRLKTTDDMIKGLHKLLYGRVGTKHDVKSHIRAFSGFVVGTPVDELVFKEKLEKWKISGLKDLCSLFSLKSSGDKASIVERLFEFLKKPYDTSNPKDRKSRGKKTTASKTSKKSTIARKKSPRDIFFAKNREVFKAKEGNESASRQEIEKQMSEAWNDLSGKERKQYVSLAENANKSATSKKKATKREIKSPEIVESDEEMDDNEKSDEEKSDADEILEDKDKGLLSSSSEE